MNEQCLRQLVTPDFRHETVRRRIRVQTPPGVCQPPLVFRFDHSLSQFTQLFWAEKGVLGNLPDELGDLYLFGSRQAPDFFDDLNRCHLDRVRAISLPGKRLQTAEAEELLADGCCVGDRKLVTSDILYRSVR